MSQSLSFAIGEVSIRQQDGLFSLNDLHRASGSEKRHQPGYFFANDQTKALVEEITNTGIPAIETRRGANGGTYACRELVIAYAAWISAAFHLKVIRVFLAVAAPQAELVPAPTIAPLNAQAMAAASKQASEYFDAARQGKYLQQPTAFPPEVLCGLLAQAMLEQRFMLSFDRCTGRMNFKPVPDDAYVLSWQQFARGVITNDIDPSNAELADLAAACNQRLARRLAA